MNYLAHQVLSFKNSDLMIGNFIADSIQGNRFNGLNDNIIKGIILHRKIDTFTDTHPIYLTSKHRFSKDFGKYSGGYWVSTGQKYFWKLKENGLIKWLRLVMLILLECLIPTETIILGGAKELGLEKEMWVGELIIFLWINH